MSRVHLAILFAVPLVVSPAVSVTTAPTSESSAVTSGAAAATSHARTLALRQPDSIAARAQRALDLYRGSSAVPGMVLGVAMSNRATQQFASGMSDSTQRRAMQPADRLLLGSVGKTYVAAIALQLVRDGRLDLDARVSRYVGGQGWYDSVPNAADITVRMLMQHTSGLVRYEFRPEFLETLTRNPDKVWDPREQVRYLHGTTAPFAAGAGWDYSDTNYLVLALVIEAITSTPIDSLIAERVLRPNGLRNTLPSDSRTLDGVAQGYAGPRNPFGGRDAMLDSGRMIINPQFEGAGGGYAASAGDLASWGALYFSGQPFGDALLKQAITGPDARALGAGTRYGLGMILRDSTIAGPVRGHSGFFPGYRTEVRHYPRLGLTLSLIVNDSHSRLRPSMPQWMDSLAVTLVNDR